MIVDIVPESPGSDKNEETDSSTELSFESLNKGKSLFTSTRSSLDSK